MESRGTWCAASKRSSTECGVDQMDEYNGLKSQTRYSQAFAFRSSTIYFFFQPLFECWCEWDELFLLQRWMQWHDGTLNQMNSVKVCLNISGSERQNQYIRKVTFLKNIYSLPWSPPSEDTMESCCPNRQSGNFSFWSSKEGRAAPGFLPSDTSRFFLLPLQAPMHSFLHMKAESSLNFSPNFM